MSNGKGEVSPVVAAIVIILVIAVVVVIYTYLMKRGKQPPGVLTPGEIGNDGMSNTDTNVPPGSQPPGNMGQHRGGGTGGG